MKTYLVGGAVRDKLLGLTPHEHDWVVVGATPAELEADGYQQVGKDFPVFLHPETRDEYALARTERKSGKGYKGFSVSFDPEVTLEQDLERRDLTINAIAEDTEGQLIDPFNGQKDIEQRLLRHVSAAFSEDPLRVLRIARFWARFAHLGFSIADNTYRLLQQMTASRELEHLTPERVWTEWQKALGTRNPELFLQLLLELNATEQVFPQLIVTKACLEHLRQTAQHTDDHETRFASIFIQQSGDFNLNQFCRQLAIPNRYRDAAQMALYQRQLVTAPNIDSSDYFKLLKDIDYWRRPQRLQQFLQLREALVSHHSLQLSTGIELAAKQTTQISAKQLQQQGLQGKQLGEALQVKRQQAFEQYFPGS
ncbi:multifunctional CCA tRNA nucleotidyl transferase/2'3'-cyclic phosphodiesterase/2'nucleotidase/phosphatase [Idiomarina seosinensis]|uniref:CCA-adding enzyme n=1 Tax=Idiomarina seosinensis TaxID=281739 RepID=A0A432Z4D9_9GAMM|nr:multifunctional CCA tRNA nucleotidyl transferase/2'3'-cyclic phosphodiesterase/2'nucleotidase/phosphatase [Idiomarina seosinensis]RUO72778.1 multifunctional CCA tRNA nucleotidyl transferase/2'3'-cyclic phosphodiesterase/2'nucleotidase/phosphatase [Idiomarina seosinensis]